LRLPTCGPSHSPPPMSSQRDKSDGCAIGERPWSPAGRWCSSSRGLPLLQLSPPGDILIWTPFPTTPRHVGRARSNLFLCRVMLSGSSHQPYIKVSQDGPEFVGRTAPYFSSGYVDRILFSWSHINTCSVSRCIANSVTSSVKSDHDAKALYPLSNPSS